MNYIPTICNIYTKGEFYNKEKNIIRITAKFDDGDIDDRVYDVPLLSIGVFRDPDPAYHKVIAFIPEEINKRISIDDPITTEIGTSESRLPIGVLIDNIQYKKLAGSIDNASYQVNSDAGTQEIRDLDFFIPTGYDRSNIDADQEIPEEDQEVRVCGIAGGKDGSILIRGAGGEISIGGDGIRINGPVSTSEGSMEKTDIIQENITLLNIIPHTLVTPFPPRIPNLGKIQSIAGIFTGAGRVLSKLV